MGLFSFFQKKKEPLAKPAFNEKRLLPRWKISAPAKIRRYEDGDYLPCQVRDLNMRGFCLILDTKITEYNGRIELYFNEKYFFDIEVSVTWHKEIDNKQIYGFKFLKIRDADKEKLYQMMKENFAGCFGKYL